MNIKELSKVYRGATPPKAARGTDEFARFVEERFYAMSYAKQEIREVWQGTEDLYYCNDWEWIVKGEGFDRPVRFPTLRDFTKTLVDVFMKDPPDILLKLKGEKNIEKENLVVGKKAYIDQRRNSIHEKTVRRQVLEDMFFFGKGIRGVSYFNIERNYDGEAITLFDNVATQRRDPRHFFVDEQAIKLHDELRVEGARDTINRIVMSYSAFKNFIEMNKEKMKFVNVDAVQPENYFTTYGLDYTVTNSREVVEKSPLWVTKLYEYENQEQDIYALVASGVTIFQTSLKKAKGTTRLSNVDYTFEPRNDSFWGNNLAQLIAPHIYLKDTVFNLELMNLQLTLQPVVAISGDFGYNPAVHFLQAGGVWEAGGQLNGKVSDSIQPIVSGNPNTKSYEMLQNINSELSITTRTDLRTLEFYPNKTATETLAQNKSMNLHNETIESVTEIESEAVLFEIFQEVMKSCMSEKDSNGNKRLVRIKDYVIDKRDGIPSFLKKSGYEDSFTLSEEMINEDCEIEVLDKRSQIAQNIEKMGRIMQALPLIGNLAQLSPEVLQKVDFIGLLTQLIEAIGLDLERSFKDMGDIYDEFEMTKEEILLGHNIDVSEDEDREESVARMKYFLDFSRKNEKDLKPTQKRALQYHISKTIENITSNHLERKRSETMRAQGAAQMPVPQQQPGAIPQPDSGLLNVSGDKATQIM